ncbi:tubulin-folding cofactor B isoform X2 [Harpia harpyja]|uniref:tubulin-folding cofactor B isoform X2 n=1 Tax=Harpia harpyja TaxID=202280 RepID=UPI0022B124C8|nr:tubulin-folding cofactor B isoform X2 [Harpia harpyja]
MKAAVEAAGAGPGSWLGTGSVSVVVSSSLNTFCAHKRYSTGLTIAEFKCKLELVVGSPASCMDLELYGAEEELLGRLDCDEALLGSYPVADGCRVHVIDQSGARMGEYEDVLQVEKYKITERDYKKQPESLWSFLRQQCWGHYDAEGTRRRAQEAVLAAALPLGARCQVRLLGQPSKLATIMFVGQTHFKPGYWVGVRYDEPLGKHDGSVGSRRYFECQPKYGAFVKPQSVTPGDFPEEEDGLEDEL